MLLVVFRNAAQAVAIVTTILFVSPGCRTFHEHRLLRTHHAPDCNDDRTRLTFAEPYQSGKIPVVLIHGVFDNSKRWATLIRDLRSCPIVCEHYQIWTIDYDSDQEFFFIAAAVRQQLVAAIQTHDPTGQDAALRQTVLIGHSMGGLLAKVVVADGESCLPVGRVIFIATPHCGSRHANFAAGGLSPLVLQTTGEPQNPNTVDILRPDSPALATIRQLPIRCDVKLHSIVGVFSPISLDGPSDGLVSVASAAHEGCESQITVPAFHAHVPHSPRTSAEVLRILQQHIAY